MAKVKRAKDHMASAKADLVDAIQAAEKSKRLTKASKKDSEAGGAGENGSCQNKKYQSLSLERPPTTPKGTSCFAPAKLTAYVKPLLLQLCANPFGKDLWAPFVKRFQLI